MNYALPLVLALVAGSVRDQHGAPIEDARVTIRQGSRTVGMTSTGPDGTFVVDANGSDAQIACAYCRTVHVVVGADGLVTAIVTRYDAVRVDGPTGDDLAHVAFLAPASMLQLAPFVVVNESARTIPGMSATDRNATIYGGLLHLDGAPDYDVTANSTPFDTLPQGGAANLDVLRVDQAFRYGDTAQGGTFAVSTIGGVSQAGIGSNTLLRAAASTDAIQSSASYSNAQLGARSERAGANIEMTTPASIVDVTLSSGSGFASPHGTSALFSSFSSAVAQIRARRGIDAYARVTADRGTYDYTSARFPDWSAWSDVELDAGLVSHAVIAPFFNVSARSSSGGYTSAATGVDPVAGTLTQARASFGVESHTRRFDAFLASAPGTAGYAGILGPQAREAGNLSETVASITYRPSSQWSLHASTSTGYTLQTFLGIYVPATLGNAYAPVINGHTNEGTIEYGDAARVRLSATALSWAGANGVATSSAGASVAWQIAPNVAVRTWLLHENSTAWNPGTVGSAWLTYENGTSFRVDAMWGRSLLDRSPRNHLEGSVSGRLSDRLDWFVSSAFVRDVQEQSAGLRIH